MRKAVIYGLVIAGMIMGDACQVSSEGETDKFCQGLAGPARAACLNLGGADGPTLNLPFASGTKHRCVQGVDGAYSHQLTMTRFDLDLDTDNWSDEMVYAPAGGTAYVHEADIERNFGRHVNIDLGDGTYAVVAHLKAIFVRDRSPVAAGQVLGLEGTTGNSTGDHVHLGVHQGKPEEPAERGVSVPARYLVRDGQQGADPISLAADQFVCDLQSGEFYEAASRVPCSHPDGTLIKTPYASKVYRLDDGRARWITDQDIFWSYGYDFGAVVTVDQAEFNSYSLGADINERGEVKAAYDASGQLWLFLAQLTRPDRYRLRVGAVDWREVLASWGLSYGQSEQPRAYDAATAQWFEQWPERPGQAILRDGTLFRTVSDSAVFVVTRGFPAPIQTWETFLRLGYDHNRILFLADGATARLFTALGSCGPEGVGCVREESLYECGAMALGVSTGSDGTASDAGVIAYDAGITNRPDAANPDQARPDAGTPAADAATADQCETASQEALDLLHDLAGGELGVLFTPSDLCASLGTVRLWGKLLRRDGTTAIPWGELTSGPAPLLWRDSFPRPGDIFTFVFAIDTVGSTVLSCRGNSAFGQVRTVFDGQELPLTVVASSEECRHQAVIPGLPEYDPDPLDAGSVRPDQARPDTNPPPEPESRTLTVVWRTPFNQPAERITLSGEYKFADGQFGFFWHELKTVYDSAAIDYQIEGVGSGDSFRFSVEYAAADGHISWSCIGPFVAGTSDQGTLQGQVSAQVDGQSVTVQKVGDPTGQTTGCGLIIQIP